MLRSRHQSKTCSCSELVNLFCPSIFVTLVPKGDGMREPPLTSEQVGISGRVIHRWKSRDNPTSTVY